MKQGSIPIDVVDEWLTNLMAIAEPKRYPGQKARMVGQIGRYLAATGTYEEPSRWERIKNRVTAIISRSDETGLRSSDFGARNVEVE